MAAPILLSSPDVGELEQEFVLRAMRSGWVAPAGPDLTAFEQEVAERAGTRYAVGLTSGTAALHLALVSWGVGPGDVVPVSTMTFAATVNAIRYVGADPYFIDCDEETGNMSPALLQTALAELRHTSRPVPVVIPVDLLGKAVDYTSLTRIARENGVRVLCDAAESFGATWRGHPAGSFGDASILSFNGNKIITTSGGGMLLTNDSTLASHARKLSTQAREPVLHYEHREIGYNYRLSNVLAALGRAQLQRLDDMMARRRRWRNLYKGLVQSVDGVRILGGSDDSQDNCWLTAIVVDPDVSPRPAEEVAASLRKRDIETRPLWKPMHIQPVYREFSGNLDGTSERLYNQGLTLPSGSALTDDEMDRVLDALSSALT